jgi:hypothetical protein
MGRGFDATTHALMLVFKYWVTIPNGVLLPDVAVLQETAELLEIAERSGDDFTLACARYGAASRSWPTMAPNTKTASRCLPRSVKPPCRSDSR